MMKKIYLTFDMDWANEGVMEFFYSTLCELDVRGTFNVTNESRLLEAIRREDRLELGIHPNFNNLLQDGEGESAGAIIRHLKEIVPEAVSVRSHCLVNGNSIRKYFVANGIRYESNTLFEPKEGMKLDCYQDFMGLVQVPLIFEDDIYLLSKDKKCLTWYFDCLDMPLVFNFHPIHLFLNTEDMNRYERSKPYYHEYEKLKTFVNIKQGQGMLDVLKEIVAIARERGYEFGKINEITV